MDIFNTVITSIDLALKAYKLVQGIKKAREVLESTHSELLDLRSILKHLDQYSLPDSSFQDEFRRIAGNCESDVKALHRLIEPFRQGPKESRFGRLQKAFLAYWKEEDIQKSLSQLRQRKLTLNIALTMFNLKGRAKSEMDQEIQRIRNEARENNITIDDTDEPILDRLLKVQVNCRAGTGELIGVTVKVEVEPGLSNVASHPPKRPQLSDPQDAKEYKARAIDFNWFLKSLESSNEGPISERRRLQVRKPSQDTCVWIEQHPVYSKWQNASESCILYLTGKIGCGKSVLTKHICDRFAKAVSNPPSRDDKIIVLNYFCSSVNQQQETDSLILKKLIHQLLYHRAYLFPSVVRLCRALDSHTSSGEWSVEELWEILSSALCCCSQTIVYCFIDALDECEKESAEKILDYLADLVGYSNSTNLLFKGFLTSRENDYLSRNLQEKHGIFLLRIFPEFVEGDIKKVVAEGLHSSTIKKRLDLSPDKLKAFESQLTGKSEGMFMWVILALKEIGNTYGPTYGSLNKLVRDLPRGLEELYNRAWLKLVKSLPADLIEPVRKILVWLVFATRPLTAAELNLAVAMDTTDNVIPSQDRLLINISAFVLEVLSPFVEIVVRKATGEADCGREPSIADAPNSLEAMDSNPNAIIRLVHKSAQEYLLKTRSLQTPLASPLSTGLNERLGHEMIAQACISYLKCEELQLGWGGPEKRDEFGRYNVDDLVRDVIKTRLKQNTLLEYAATYWGLHVRLWETSRSDFESDTTGQWAYQSSFSEYVLDFISNYPLSLGNALQARVYTLNPEIAIIWPDDDIPLLDAVARDFLAVVRLLLDKEDINVNQQDSAGCTPLSWACSHAPGSDGRTQCENIVKLLVDRNADPTIPNKLGFTAIHDAASNGQIGPLRIFLDHQINKEIQSPEGDTPLHLAIECGQLEAASLLINSGANKEAADKGGCTPLHRAARSGLVDAVALLLRLGVERRAGDERGQIPLHYAAASGSLEATKLLLGNGVDKNARCKHGRTPLVQATIYGEEATVQELLKYEPDVNLSDEERHTPLHWAAFYGYKTILQSIVKAKANVDARDTQGMTPLHAAAGEGNAEIVDILIRANAEVDVKDEENWTPLHIAASNGRLEAAKILLNQSANVGSRTTGDMTPLHLAAANGHRALIQLFLHSGSQTDEWTNNGSITKLTALHFAAMYGYEDAVQLLLDSGADKDARESRLGTPLHLAAQNGHIECVRRLLAVGVSVDPKDDLDHTPLYLAASNDHDTVIQTLIDSGADTGAEDKDGEEPLHQASRHGMTAAVKILVDLKANVDAVNKDGNSPIMIALLNSKFEAARILLASNANVRVKNKRSETCIHLAAARDNTNILKTVLEAVESTSIDQEDEDGHSALYIAARAGLVQNTKLLLDKNAAASSIIIDRAFIRFPTNGGSAAVIKLFLDRKLLGVEVRDKDGWTALHFAAAFEHEVVSKVLLDYGTDISAKANTGQTALHMAVNRNMNCLVDLYLERGADINTVDRDGWTPLHFAVAAGNLEMVRLLIDKGCDYRLSDFKKHLPLHIAASRGHKEIIDVLIQKSYQTVVDNNGWAPSTIAESKGFQALSEQLAELDARVPSRKNHSLLRPTRWCDSDMSPELSLECDNTVKLPDEIQRPNVSIEQLLSGPINILNKTYSIRADFCVPWDVREYYFEVEVLEDGGTRFIAVGLTTHVAPLDSLPGNSPGTYGYHGDDGRKRDNHDNGYPYADLYTKGDTVGCGIIPKAGKVYFTKNGQWKGMLSPFSTSIQLRIAFHDVRGQLYPTVGLAWPGTKLRASFGITPPEHPNIEDDDTPVSLASSSPVLSSMEPRLSSELRQILEQGNPPESSPPVSSSYTTGEVQEVDD